MDPAVPTEVFEHEKKLAKAILISFHLWKKCLPAWYMYSNHCHLFVQAVTFLVTMTKNLTKGNLRGKGLFWTHSLKGYSHCGGEGMEAGSSRASGAYSWDLVTCWWNRSRDQQEVGWALPTQSSHPGPLHFL